MEGQYLSAYGFSTEQNDEWIRLPWNDTIQMNVSQWKKHIQEHVNLQEIGILVFESGNTSGMVKLPPKNLVIALSELIRSINGILIANEVTCGIGRTGKWFGYMHYDIKPDIIAIGKGLGNGYPISSVIIHHKIIDILKQYKFIYAQSHQNDPLGCRIAFEVLSTIEKEHLIENANNLSDYFKTVYHTFTQKHSNIKELRIRGLLIAIQLDKTLNETTMIEVDNFLFSKGIIVGINTSERIIRLYIPLITKKHMIDYFFDMLNQCFTYLNI